MTQRSPGLRKLFHYYCNTYSSGISGAFENAADFQQSIRQACSSLRIGIMLKQQWTYPDDLHIYNLLMAVHDNAALKNFYTMTLAPLIQYEKRYSVDLIKTIETYLTCDGDYKKERLFCSNSMKIQSVSGLTRQKACWAWRIAIINSLSRCLWP